MNTQQQRQVGAWDLVTVNEATNNSGHTVDIIGIVVEVGIPHKSNGPGMYVRNINLLPHIRGHLDIILLHHVRIGIHDQNPYVSFRQTSSFALFDGRDNDGYKPYQLSPGFQGLQSAKKFVHNLRLWSSITRFDSGISEYALPLADIGGRYFVDLVCKVLHVCEVSKNKWMLFVWDGTDAPPLSLTTELIDEELNSLPLRVESFCLPEHILFKFPRIGTVLRILVDEKYETFGIHFQHDEKWIRLRNLICKMESGFWKGIFTLETKFRLLSEQDGSVKDRLRFCDERIREQGRIPSAAFPRFDILTVTDNEEAEFATLLDLLCSPLQYGGFKCVVRVLASYPLRAKDFRSPTGLYRLRLTLEDPTARIHAYLSHEDATYLFGGHLTEDTLIMKMSKLLGIAECENSPRNPPWVQCCIGFNSSDVNNLGNKHFHICKTRFVV